MRVEEGKEGSDFFSILQSFSVLPVLSCTVLSVYYGYFI